MPALLNTVHTTPHSAGFPRPQQRQAALLAAPSTAAVQVTRGAPARAASQAEHKQGQSCSDAQNTGRRAVLAGVSLLLFTPPLGRLVKAEPLECGARSVTYTDAKQKFSLCVPSAFEQKEKMGATSLFEDPERRSTQVGVTVNPVRISSLDKFGSLQDVGDKLLGAERAKESTLECNLLYQESRVSGNGVTFYEYGYELDSTRGRKRIQTSVTISNSKLYILNINVKCDKESCAAFEDTIGGLRSIMKSFSVY